jgi:DUF971 family protein
MQPRDIQIINEFLAVIWDDAHESVYPLEYLRRHCPCAACAGETVGRQHFHPPQPIYAPESFQLKTIERVGSYALRPVWKDGHASGFFAFEYLRRLCPCDACKGTKSPAD